MRQSFSEAGPICSCARHLIREDPLAPGLFQRVALQVEILVCGRDAGVADEHALAFLKVVKSGVGL
jgi:hypothetical protein